MPQQNMSEKLGSSPSKVINTVVQNNKNVQQPVSVPDAVNHSFNKEPVPVPGAGK